MIHIPQRKLAPNTSPDLEKYDINAEFAYLRRSVYGLCFVSAFASLSDAQRTSNVTDDHKFRPEKKCKKNLEINKVNVRRTSRRAIISIIN